MQYVIANISPYLRCSNTLRPGTMTTPHTCALIFVGLMYYRMGAAGLIVVGLLYETDVGFALDKQRVRSFVLLALYMLE